MSKSVSITVSIVALALGILFIAVSGMAEFFSWIVKALGWLLLLPSIGVVVGMFAKAMRQRIDEPPRRTVAWGILIACIIGIIVSVLFLALTSFWIVYVYIFFAIVLAICGIYQLGTLWNMRRETSIRGWLMTVPILSIIGGILLVVIHPSHDEPTIRHHMALFTGIVLVACSLNGLWGSFAAHREQRRMKALAAEGSEATADETADEERDTE